MSHATRCFSCAAATLPALGHGVQRAVVLQGRMELSQGTCGGALILSEEAVGKPEYIDTVLTVN